ncbi:DUF4388 domain-containing protein [bacterium]|nr:DUF4388 domain-containing protein [candidate division CSSED10-310 bacterium]
MTETPREISSGLIRWVPIPFIMCQIMENRFSGLLETTWSTQCKRFYFREGSIVTAESSSIDEQLSELMYRGGVISRETLDRLNDVLEKKGWSSPEVEEIVDSATQTWWLKTLIREALMTVIEWNDGEFSLIEFEQVPPELPVVDMDPDRLLNSIIKRIQDIDDLALILGGYERVLRIKPGAMTGTMAKEITPQDGFFLSRIDGKMNLKQLFTMASSQKLDMARSIFHLCIKSFLELEPESEKRLKMLYAEQHGIIEDAHLSIPEESSEPDTSSSVESDAQMDEVHIEMDNIMLTTDELKELRQMAGRMNGDFLDLAKALNLDLNQKPGDVGYDAEISYLRGDKFVDQRAGGLNIDGLSRVGSTDAVHRDSDDDARIAFIIDGKVVDGESDLFGTGLSKDIFEEDDEEKQWNLWMVSEEDLQRDFERDWTSTWTDWVENTGELGSLRRTVEEMENKLKTATDDKIRESLLGELRKHNANIQDLIRRKKREIFSIHRRMQLMTYYELLRVDRTSSPEMIQMAYDQWEGHLSPDDEFIREFSSMAPQIKDIIDLITVAHRTLLDPELRKKYDALLSEKEQATEELLNKKVLLAEDHLMSARTAKRRGDNMLAMRFLRGCISLDPSRAVYYREMAQLLAENKNWRKEALRFYHRAFHLEPNDQEILLNVAELAAELELKGFAIRALKQVRKMDPANLKAKRLLRTIEQEK